MRTTWTYLPILKWKQGERIALRELSESQWKDIVPLLELPAIGCAPDSASLRQALPEYLVRIANELDKSIPEGKPICVDVRHVSPEYTRPVRLLKVVCAGLVRAGRTVIPVITGPMVSEDALELHRLREFEEYILRLRTTVIEASQVTALITATINAGLRRPRLHVLIDQYSIVGDDPKAKFSAVRPYLETAVKSGCASTTVSGGSFPLNLVGFKQGVHDLERVEWKIWERVQKVEAFAPVRYSDYTVSNPAPAPNIDPTQMNPSVAIRYAADGHWRLYKAGGFKKGTPNQYKALCSLLLQDNVYSGPNFSYGDACYEKASNGKLGNGNPSSWRRDATSHHLVLTKSMLGL